MMPAYGLIILNISVAKHAAGNLGGLGTESAERTEVATQRSQGSQRRAQRGHPSPQSRASVIPVNSVWKPPRPCRYLRPVLDRASRRTRNGTM